MIQNIEDLDPGVNGSTCASTRSERDASSHSGVNRSESRRARCISSDTRTIGEIPVAVAIDDRVDRVRLSRLKFAGQRKVPLVEWFLGKKPCQSVPCIEIRRCSLLLQPRTIFGQ